jgi:dinuclear metal center YbgI/SA1388 family protein
MFAKEIIRIIDHKIPERLQESWDNCGLQLGDVNQEVKRIMVVLEVTEAVVAEAIANECQMIVTHHPFFFTPIKTLDFTSFRGRLAKRLIDHGILVYSAHTNYDQMPFGVSDALGEWLGLENRRILQRTKGLSGYKLATFVPETHAKEVLFAMLEAGAGTLGHYSHCSFSTEGIGTFRAHQGAKPFLGQVNHLAEFKEIKVEAMVTEGNKNQVIEAMLKAHPYEVAAYDLVVMENDLSQAGYGMVGQLAEPVEIGQWAEDLAKRWSCPIMVHGDRQAQVQTVSCCGGEGADLIPYAARQSQVYVTGDVRASRAQMAIEAGLAVLVVPHYKTEKPGAVRLAGLLSDWLEGVDIVQTDRDDLVRTSWAIPFAEEE